jgi:hypothetical protein
VAEERFDPSRPTLDLAAIRRERERIVAEEIRAGRMEWPDAEIVPFEDAGPGWFV